MSEADIPFRKEMEVRYGVPEQVSPLIRRVLSENPSPFSYHGTNSYIVGRGNVAVIDPGPASETHIRNILAALEGETVTHILVTHTHSDHSPGAALLHAATGAPVHGARPRPPRIEAPRAESVQSDFAPDVTLSDGMRVAGDGWTIEAVWTPGHMSNHHCLALLEERALFSGDHVMGWNTTIVSPPDGNMAEYLDSLRRCIDREDAVYWPGHGPAIENPRPFVRAYLRHRQMREGEIGKCLEDGLSTIPEMVGRMYRHLPEKMHGAAGRAVLAHLEHMVATGRAACDGAPGPESVFRRA